MLRKRYNFYISMLKKRIVCEKNVHLHHVKIKI